MVKSFDIICSMQSLAIACFPQIPNNSLDRFREQYDPEYKRIAPHITLVYPISEISMKDVKTHLGAIASKTQSFSITIQGIKRTDDDFLFLLVKEGNEKIIALQESLCSGILASYVPEYLPYTPHITIGYFRSKDNLFNTKLFDQAYAEAKEMDKGITCSFDSLSLLSGDENHTHIVQTFLLQK